MISMRSPVPGEQHGVVAHNVAAAHGGKADGGGSRSPVTPLAAIHGAVFQLAAQPWAMISPIFSAVPEGASTLWRWWASMISMS